MKNKTSITRPTAIKIMAFNLLLVAVFFVGCNTQPSNHKTIERVGTGDNNFDIVTIDSCQYIVYLGSGICHKGDCSNKKHCH